MKLTKWMKLSGANGFSSAAKMKWRVSSNFMGAIAPPSKPVKLHDEWVMVGYKGDRTLALSDLLIREKFSSNTSHHQATP
jgi:hypothetical protein